MARYSNNIVAALAAVVIALTSMSALIEVPPAAAGTYAAAPLLA
ncbi:hypothetical protein ACXYN8_00795 [Altererythrobacter sp. CAU 1778]